MSNAISPTSVPEPEKGVYAYRQRQEQFLRVVLYATCVIGLPALIASALTNPNPVAVGIDAGAYVILLLVAFIKLPYWQKAVVLLGLIYALGFVGLTETGIWADARLFFLGFIVMASLLFSITAGVIAIIISFASIAVMGQLVISGRFQLINPAVQPGDQGIWLAYSLGLLILSILIISTVNAFQKEFEAARQKTNVYLQELIDEHTGLEERVEDRTQELNRRSSQLEVASQIARAAAEVHDLKGLLDSVVRQISTRFGYYHAGIFLTDPSGQKVALAAASSEGGQKMLARGHKLEIGRQGIVGFAAYQKRSRIAQDVGADETYFNNPDLPETHSEVALPLTGQNRLIGVLDIQSQEHNAFSLEDVYALQTMADQIAMAIENTRLIEQSRSAIQDLEAISAVGIKKAWEQRLGGQFKGFTYTALGVTPLEKRKADSGRTSDRKSLLIALNLRGKQIGTLSLQRLESDPAWTATDREMLERVATQVVLSIENARLLEDSQRQALREQAVNELSSQLSHSLAVDTLLQNAVREIHRLPQVSEVSVYLQPTEEANNPE